MGSSGAGGQVDAHPASNSVQIVNSGLVLVMLYLGLNLLYIYALRVDVIVSLKVPVANAPAEQLRVVRLRFASIFERSTRADVIGGWMPAHAEARHYLIAA